MEMMNFIPFNRFEDKLAASKEESDLGYFYDLLLYGEFLTKIIALQLVSSLNEDNERTQYRFEHRLIRANSVGEYSKIIEEIINGPAAQQITSYIRDYELKELSQRSKKNDWQYQAQELLHDCLKAFKIVHNPLPLKSPLRNWFETFTVLRNKTKGHGAPNIESCTIACPKIYRAIKIIISNYSAFKRPWAFLYRNLSGKYRVSVLTESIDGFEKYKREATFSLPNGIYSYLDRPREVKLFYTNSEFSDFWIINGNFSRKKFEAISYLTDDRIQKDGSFYLSPITQLPKSQTEGLSDLEVLGNCFTNIPKLQDKYIERKDLEDQLFKLLMQNDRFPIITLLGRGGIGKTSLAINLITKIAKTDRFQLIIWFSARDVDLLMEGPKQVQTKVLSINDIAADYCSLVSPQVNKNEVVQVLSEHLKINPNGKTLYVFDNFETVTDPVEDFEWINTYIRNPNKVLITSRLSRNFKADYPLEVPGMNYDECKELIDVTSKLLNVSELVDNKVAEEIISESDGHPYIIKILLGELSRSEKVRSVKRIVAEQDKILIALFKRTFNTLSPAEKRVFLTLCSWNSIIPLIAVEAVLWRPENEKMDVQNAIEELRKSSFIEIIEKNKQAFINVPLAAILFGRSELEIYPEKFKILADRELLMEFGAMGLSNISSGLAYSIERKFKAISKRIASIEDFKKELPLLEYIASKYAKTYEFIIEVFEEYEDYENVKYYLREYLKIQMVVYEKIKLWLKVAEVCQITNDWEGESHAYVELVQLPGVELQQISDVANRINKHMHNDLSARQDEYKSGILSNIISAFMARINQGNATDYSRLGWLLLNVNKPKDAKEIALKGLELDNNNIHCQRLIASLN